jgi:hypothetical protein
MSVGSYVAYPPLTTYRGLNHATGVATALGDLLYVSDPVNGLVSPASQLVDQGNAAQTQRLFASLFAGVANSTQGVSDATARPASVLTDQIFDAFPCVNSTFQVGDFVAPSYSAGILNTQLLVRVTDASLAIGEVLSAAAVATTTVRVQFTSRTLDGLTSSALMNATVTAPPAAALTATGGTMTYTGGDGCYSSTSTASAGGPVVIRGGFGGATTTGTAGASGTTTIGGAAGVNATTGTPGAGAATIVQGGAGGTATGANAGGAGGAVTITGGFGGNKTTTAAAAGGAGGVITITGGDGGDTASSGSDAGGAGATVTIQGGEGGDASAGTGNGGAGGNINLVPGLGGTTTGGAAGVPGEVQINSAAGLFQAVYAQGPGTVPTTSTSYVFFMADRAYRIKNVSCIAATAGGAASTVTVTKDTGTNAPGGGTAVITAPMALSGTANTRVVGTLTGTLATLALAAGDRLSTTWAGTISPLAGAVVVCNLVPI